MAKKKGPNFSPEFRLETAQLVLDQGYTHKEAADAMGVCYSTLGKWVRQLVKNAMENRLSRPRR